MKLFPVVKIWNKTYLISDFNLVNLFLLEGENKAMLIDTGCGIGNVNETVSNLTDQPLIVAATHGHFDHDGGGGQFPSIFEHPADWKISQKYEKSGRSLKENYARTRGAVRNPEAVEKLLTMIVDSPQMNRVELRDNQTFDLGGRVIETIHTPGHTIGSCCFLDQKNHILFSGDMFNTESLLLNFDDSASSVKEYNASAKRIWSRRNEFDSLATGHSVLNLISKSIISEYIDVTERLMNRTLHGQPYADGIHDGMAVKEGNITIFYNPDRIE